MAEREQFSSEQRIFIIERLAAFETPKEVQAGLKETFGIDAALDKILFYDPSSAHGLKGLAPRWKELFEAARARFLADVAAIGVSHQSYRLRRLQRLLDRPGVDKNPKMVLEILEQAAKEVGGAFTNKREVTGANGGALVITLADEQLDERIQELEKRKTPEAVPNIS